METCCSQSILEILPDEILLEVCKYLLCSDIIYSFVGLNCRMTQMISQYRHHVSFHKTSISKFNDLCLNVLPQIGSHVHSLLVDCCYSVLQNDLFIQYFGKKMSIIFPKLERITFVLYQGKQLVDFLNTLNDLPYLVEIRLYDLFQVQTSYQPIFLRSLFQANNNRLTTILFDDQSGSLSFNNSECYMNVRKLRVNLETVADLPSLFAAVPNVQYLDVVLDKGDRFLHYFNPKELAPFLYLTDFRLKSIQMWTLEELSKLFVQLPAVRYLSLFFSTADQCLTQGDIILPSLPSTVQQFNYAVSFFFNNKLDQEDVIIASWPSSHPIVCFVNDVFLFIHTLPCHFARVDGSLLFGKMISSHLNDAIGYDTQVENLDFTMNKNSSLNKSLEIISQCRRVRKIFINVESNSEIVKEEKLSVSCFPKLSRLTHVTYYALTPLDVKLFSMILNAAPNLFRLDLSFSNLLRLMEDQQICHLLGQRITSMSIFKNELDSSLIKLNEEYMPIIASVFPRLRDLYVDWTHLPRSSTVVSNENIFDSSSSQNTSIQSCEQKCETISPFSSESMLLCLLKNLKEHKLLSLCIVGQFIEEIKQDSEQWLRVNTTLCEQQFKADFYIELNELIIWM